MRGIGDSRVAVVVQTLIFSGPIVGRHASDRNLFQGDLFGMPRPAAEVLEPRAAERAQA